MAKGKGMNRNQVACNESSPAFIEQCERVNKATGSEREHALNWARLPKPLREKLLNEADITAPPETPYLQFDHQQRNAIRDEAVALIGMGAACYGFLS